MLDKIKENMQYDQQVGKKESGHNDKSRGQSFSG